MITPDTLDAYLAEVATEQDTNPHYRRGQCYFNVLYRLDPDCANAIRATTADPFYEDDNIPQFLAALSDLRLQ